MTTPASQCTQRPLIPMIMVPPLMGLGGGGGGDENVSITTGGEGEGGIEGEGEGDSSSNSLRALVPIALEHWAASSIVLAVWKHVVHWWQGRKVMQVAQRFFASLVSTPRFSTAASWHFIDA